MSNDANLNWSFEAIWSYRLARQRRDILNDIWQCLKYPYEFAESKPLLRRLPKDSKLEYPYELAELKTEPRMAAVHIGAPPDAIALYRDRLTRITAANRRMQKTYCEKEAERIHLYFGKNAREAAAKHLEAHPPPKTKIGRFEDLERHAFESMRNALSVAARGSLDLGLAFEKPKPRSATEVLRLAKSISIAAQDSGLPTAWLDEIKELRCNALRVSSIDIPDYFVDELITCIDALQVKVDDSIKSMPLGTSDSWSPPPGFVSTHEIETNSRFRKNNKNPAPSTIDGWKKRSVREGIPVKVIKGPSSPMNYYPEAWVLEQIKRWRPQKTKTES